VESPRGRCGKRVSAALQVGSAIAALGGEVVRDITGSHGLAWVMAGALRMVAAVISIRRRAAGPRTG
jgi:hypothetical protein